MYVSATYVPTGVDIYIHTYVGISNEIIHRKIVELFMVIWRGIFSHTYVCLWAQEFMLGLLAGGAKGVKMALA